MHFLKPLEDFNVRGSFPDFLNVTYLSSVKNWKELEGSMGGIFPPQNKTPSETFEFDDIQSGLGRCGKYTHHTSRQACVMLHR
jgi:hypothetical protein